MIKADGRTVLADTQWLLAPSDILSIIAIALGATEAVATAYGPIIDSKVNGLVRDLMDHL